MTHEELHAALAELGWTVDRRDDGTVFYYSPWDIVQRAVQTVPELPGSACCLERRGKRQGPNRAECSLAEALEWARGHERAARRLEDQKVDETMTQRYQGASVDQVVADAIDESVSTNSIVHVDPVLASYDAIDAMRDTLYTECEGDVVSDGVHEFWGQDCDGNSWRVHLTIR